MKTKTRLVALAGAAALALTFGEPASAAMAGLSQSYSLSLTIPDNNSVGVSDTEQFSLPAGTPISQLAVTLDIAGGYNGDYFVYLRHGNTLAVLLNRVGTTA